MRYARMCKLSTCGELFGHHGLSKCDVRRPKMAPVFAVLQAKRVPVQPTASTPRCLADPCTETLKHLASSSAQWCHAGLFWPSTRVSTRPLCVPRVLASCWSWQCVPLADDWASLLHLLWPTQPSLFARQTRWTPQAQSTHFRYAFLRRCGSVRGQTGMAELLWTSSTCLTCCAPSEYLPCLERTVFFLKPHLALDFISGKFNLSDTLFSSGTLIRNSLFDRFEVLVLDPKKSDLSSQVEVLRFDFTSW